MIACYAAMCLLMVLMNAVATQNRVTKIASSGNGFTCAILEDTGALKCFGRYDYNNMRGDRPENMGANLEYFAGFDANVTDVVVSWSGLASDSSVNYMCVIQSGQVKCWLVADPETSSLVTTPFTTLNFGTKSIDKLFGSIGGRNMCGLVQGDHSQLICWGDGQTGINGQENANDIEVDPTTNFGLIPPINFAVSEPIADVAITSYMGCVLFSQSHKIKCWGYILLAGLSANTMGAHLPFLQTSTQNLTASSISLSVNQGNIYFAYVDYATQVVQSFQIFDWYIDALSIGYFDFGAVPGFGVPIQAMRTINSICALSSTGYFSCANLGTDSGDMLGLGSTNNVQVAGLTAPIDFGTNVLIDSAVLATNIDANYYTAIAICTLAQDHLVRCFGRNFLAGLGLGIPDGSRVIGSAPGDMGDALPAVDLYGACGFGYFAVDNTSDLNHLSTKSPPLPDPATYLAPDTCPLDLSDVAATISLPVSPLYKNPTRNSYDRMFGPLPSQIYSNGEPWLTEVCPYTSIGIPPPYAFVVVAFTPDVSAHYVIAPASGSITSDLYTWMAIYACDSSGQLTNIACRAPYAPRMDVYLSADVTYLIVFGQQTVFFSSTFLVMSSLNPTVDTYDAVWSVASQSSITLTMNSSDPVPLYPYRDVYFQVAPTDYVFFFVPNVTAYHTIFVESLTELINGELISSASGILSLSIRTASNVTVTLAECFSGEIISDLTCSALLYVGVNYIVSCNVIDFNQDGHLRATLGYEVQQFARQLEPNLACERCPESNSDGDVGLGTLTRYAQSVDDCVSGLTIIKPPPFELNVQSIGTRTTINVTIINDDSLSTTIGTSVYRMPYYVHEIWVLEPGDTTNRLAFLTTTGFDLYAGASVVLLIAILTDRIPVDVPVYEASIPLLWWTTGAPNVDGTSDENKIGTVIEFPIYTNPNVFVSPSRFDYVLDENVEYDAASLSPPLTFTLFNSLDPGITTVQYIVYHGCDGPPYTPDDDTPPDFIAWNSSIYTHSELVTSQESFLYKTVSSSVDIVANSVLSRAIDGVAICKSLVAGESIIYGLPAACLELPSDQTEYIYADGGIPGIQFFAFPATTDLVFAPLISGSTPNLVIYPYDQTLQKVAGGQAALTEFTLIGRCDIDVVGGICNHTINVTAIANHIYGIAFGAPETLITYKSRPAPSLQSQLIPITKSDCILVKAIVGTSTQFRTLTFNVNINFVFKSPCPPGTFSTQGDNQYGCTVCPPGSYQNQPGQTACIGCPTETPLTLEKGSKSLVACVAPSDRLKNLLGQVLVCPIGGNCTKAGTDLPSLPLLPGYWRTSENSSNVVHCLNPQYCVGGAFTNKSLGDSSSLFFVDGPGRRRLSDNSSTTSPLCYPNHVGVMCASCLPGYAKQGSNRYCTLCTSDQRSADVARIAGTLGGLTLGCILVIVFIVFFFGREEGLDESSTSTSSLNKHSARFYALIDLGIKFRVVIGLFQVLGAMSITFVLVLPPFFQGISQFFSVLTFDLIAMFDFGCSISQNNFYSSLLASTLAPVFITLIIFAVHFFGVEMRRGRISATALDRYRNISWTIFLILLFLVYPSVSQRVLSTFNCVTYDDGSFVLVADPSVSCSTAEYQAYVVYASFMVLFYVIGVPLSQFYLLYRKRKALMHPDLRRGSNNSEINEDHREFDTSIERSRFLWRPYKAEYYYYEIIEMIRKLLQSSVLVFVSSGTTLQMIYQALLAIAFVTFLQQTNPYRRRSNNYLAIVSLWVVFFVTFVTLLIKLDTDATAGGVSIGQGYDIATMNSILVALVFIVPVLAFIQVLDEFHLLEAMHAKLCRGFRLQAASVSDPKQDGMVAKVADDV